MLTSIQIRNFKSIKSIKLDLGRINVLIGENGAGKSNILEAIALAAAASAGKLDNEFLSSRGIRVTDPVLMRPAFDEGGGTEPVEVTVANDGGEESLYHLTHDNGPYGEWTCVGFNEDEYTLGLAKLLKEFAKTQGDAEISTAAEAEISLVIWKAIGDVAISNSDKFNKNNTLERFLLMRRRILSFSTGNLSDFIIYSPENTSLRLFEREGQVRPLGINGEGLFKLLQVLHDQDDRQAIDSITQGLKLFGWFKDFGLASNSAPNPVGLRITDRFVHANARILDQKSVNEGFLFLLFYGALFATDLTPRFFAIDNVDASLNPKLCRRLMGYLTDQAKTHDKQVIFTTHNPAILDGLNLDDDDQRLFVVSRKSSGETKIKRVQKKPQPDGAPPLRLSEAFLSGALGGLPKGF